MTVSNRPEVDEFINDVYDGVIIMGTHVKPAEILYHCRPLLYRDMCNGYDDMVEVEKQEAEEERLVRYGEELSEGGYE